MFSNTCTYVTDSLQDRLLDPFGCLCVLTDAHSAMPSVPESAANVRVLL